MSTEKYLAVFLDGPMQSWGVASRFDNRNSLSFPSRSALTGILCAALGIPKNDTGKLAQINDLHLTTVVFNGQSGILASDYHTVGAAYDPKKQRGYIPVNADGKTKANASVTNREYLQNARFGAIFSGEESLIKKCSEALDNPCWGVWLGRKSCIPASPLNRGIFNSQDEAVTALKNAAKEEVLRIYTEEKDYSSGTDVLMDIPIDFERREFRPRYIARETLHAAADIP